MATSPATEPDAPGAMAPVPYRVTSRMQETEDTFTLELEPLAQPVVPEPGQFNMLWAFGVGEVPISTSGEPAADGGALVHTIRDVGAVSHALSHTEPGGVIGVRGPFGTSWPLAEAEGGDLVIVAGGIGLAPLRPAVYTALDRRAHYGTVAVVVGARTPGDLLYVEELEQWRARFDVDVGVTVDTALVGWRGRVGVVTRLIPDLRFDPEHMTALVVGPEVMMSFAVRALLERGAAPERIFLSLERDMRCGLGHCGHCQLGPVLVCRDGPVFSYDDVRQLLEVREL